MVADAVSTVSDLIAAVKTNEYDLIVLDRLLGAVDSLETIPQIRQTCPKTRILVLSALEPAKTLFQKSPQVKGFVTKPFKPEELVEKIRATLGV